MTLMTNKLKFIKLSIFSSIVVSIIASLFLTSIVYAVIYVDRQQAIGFTGTADKQESMGFDPTSLFYIGMIGSGTNPVEPPVTSIKFPRTLNVLPNWWETNTNLTKLPFYETFNEQAHNMGMSTAVLYLMMMLATVSAVGLGVLLFTGSGILTIGAMLMTLGAAVGTTIVPGWMVFAFVILALGIYYLARQH